MMIEDRTNSPISSNVDDDCLKKSEGERLRGLVGHFVEAYAAMDLA